MRQNPIVLILVIAALAASCSNGAGNSIIIDPPLVAVVEQTPVPNATVEPITDVVARFAAPLVTGALSGDALVVADGSGPLAGNITYEEATRSLRWRPIREMPRGALVTVTLLSLSATNGGVVPPTQWSFRVREGQPSPAVELAPSVSPNSGTSDRGLFVSMYADGSAQVAVENRSFRLSRVNTFTTEILAGGTVRGLHIDANHNAVALTVDGAGQHTPIHLARRDSNGTWAAEMITNSGVGTPVSTRLHGSENGDLLAHMTTRVTGPTRYIDSLHTTRSGPGSWQSLTVPASASWNSMFATIDGGGHVATLHAEFSGDFILAQRYDPDTGVPSIFTLGSGTFLSAIGLGVSVDGRMRAVWRDPSRGVVQRRAPAGDRFGPETSVPVALTTGMSWYTAPTGAVVAIGGGRVFRSEADADEWVEAPMQLPAPRAVAMSPRGEAAIVYFEGPDLWSLVRWRAGEPMGAPTVIAIHAAPFNAVRDAAVAIDGSGRVVVVIVPDAGQELLAVRID